MCYVERHSVNTVVLFYETRGSYIGGDIPAFSGLYFWDLHATVHDFTYGKKYGIFLRNFAFKMIKFFFFKRNLIKLKVEN